MHFLEMKKILKGYQVYLLLISLSYIFFPLFTYIFCWILHKHIFHARRYVKLLQFWDFKHFWNCCLLFVLVTFNTRFNVYNHNFVVFFVLFTRFFFTYCNVILLFFCYLLCIAIFRCECVKIILKTVF